MAASRSEASSSRPDGIKCSMICCRISPPPSRRSRSPPRCRSRRKLGNLLLGRICSMVSRLSVSSSRNCAITHQARFLPVRDAPRAFHPFTHLFKATSIDLPLASPWLAGLSLNISQLHQKSASRRSKVSSTNGSTPSMSRTARWFVGHGPVHAGKPSAMPPRKSLLVHPLIRRCCRWRDSHGYHGGQFASGRITGGFVVVLQGGHRASRSISISVVAIDEGLVEFDLPGEQRFGGGFGS